MTSQDNPRSRRVWTADEIEQQLDEIAVVLSRAPGQILNGFLFGTGTSRKRKPRPEKEEPR